MRNIISDKARARWSKRSSDGKILVDYKDCPVCGHHKVITYLSMNSLDFNRSKCCKCKRWIDES